MSVICFYDGLIGRYALQETEGRITRMWLGDRISLVPDHGIVEETALLKEAKLQLDAYFAGKLREFTVPLALEGSGFQLKVWEMLRTIPYGTVITYRDLAEKTGNPRAARAVGMANSRNPLPVFIPCHRVMGTNGKLVGYTGGLGIKLKLLQLEGIHLL